MGRDRVGRGSGPTLKRARASAVTPSGCANTTVGDSSVVSAPDAAGGTLPEPGATAGRVRPADIARSAARAPGSVPRQRIANTRWRSRSVATTTPRVVYSVSYTNGARRPFTTTASCTITVSIPSPAVTHLVRVRRDWSASTSIGRRLNRTDRASQAHAVVVTNRHARQPRRGGADHVPAGRVQVNEIPARRVVSADRAEADRGRVRARLASGRRPVSIRTLRPLRQAEKERRRAHPPNRVRHQGRRPAWMHPTGLRLSTNASVRFSRSTGDQNSGFHPASTNASGGRSRATPTHALTPRTNAVGDRFRVGAVARPLRVRGRRGTARAASSRRGR